MARDNQRSKVYDWESKLPKKELSFEECKVLLTKACQYYGKPIPHLADGRGTRIAYGASYRVSLPKWARTNVVVLHEAAHSIHSKYREGDEASHGKEFMRILIDLLAHFKVQPRVELARSAKLAGLKIAPVAAARKRVSAKDHIREHANNLIARMSNSYGLSTTEVKAIFRNL